MLLVRIRRSNLVNGCLVELLENPQELLSETEQIDLVKTLNAISIEAFDKATPMQETWERTILADRIYLVKQNEEIVGYATNDDLKLNGKIVNYFGSALFKRKIQLRGLYNLLNVIRLESEHDGIIMTRTQNPVVMHNFKKLCVENNYLFFPNKTASSDDIMRIAKEYSNTVDADFICKGVYGRELMNETPKPIGKITDLFTSLNLSEGDGLIMIGSK